MKTLLVIDYGTNWFDVFGRKFTLANGEEVHVDQTEWKLMTVQMSAEDGAVVHCGASSDPFPFSPQGQERVVRPDFLLVRNFPINLRSKDYKNQLMGLMAGHVGCVNSLHSIFMCMHRPLLYGELLRVAQRIHADPESSEEAKSIDVIPLRYFDNTTDRSLGASLLSRPTEEVSIHSGQFPRVVKVSNTHAGYGKMFVHSDSEFDDLRSILAIHDDYYTAEPKLEFEYEFRIQKIGTHYRCFRRNSDTCWKGNWGNVQFQDHPMQEHYRVWADACSEIFGGLDIIGIDLLHLKDGRDVIIELNDTASGTMWEHAEEDNGHMKSIVLEKMNQLFGQ